MKGSREVTISPQGAKIIEEIATSEGRDPDGILKKALMLYQAYSQSVVAGEGTVFFSKERLSPSEMELCLGGEKPFPKIKAIATYRLGNPSSPNPSAQGYHLNIRSVNHE